jgi:hypothetical protein
MVAQPLKRMNDMKKQERQRKSGETNNMHLGDVVNFVNLLQPLCIIQHKESIGETLE